MLQSHPPLIVARFARSLDGFAAGPDGMPGLAAKAGAVAMGRDTFDAAVGDSPWPWPGVDVHVLTSRPLPAREFGSPVTAHADPEKMVEALRRHGRGALVLGGPRTTHALIELGAVDRLEVLLVPVLFGEGLPFALEEASAHSLRLTSSKAFDDGAVQLTYEFEKRGKPMKKLAAAVLSLRVAYGAALLIAPGKVAGNRWLGPGARQPAATVGLRGLGAREVALHGIALAILARDGEVRPWLAASIAGDLADIGSTFASREGLPDGSAVATAAVAGGSAALTAAVAAALDD